MHGRISVVQERYLGSTLAEDATAGDSSITVDDTTDFDEAGSLVLTSSDGLTTETIDYTDADEDTDVITLDGTLANSYTADDGVDVSLSPLSPERYAILVENDNPQDEEGLWAVVPHSLYDKIPVGVRDLEAGEGETVNANYVGDELVISDVTAQLPVVDGSYIDPVTLPPPEASDGDPPLGSPTPDVKGGPGFITAVWDEVPNADPVTYEVHISTASGFTPDGTTLFAETLATSILLDTLADHSTALVHGTTYYVKLIEFDADGAAAAGSEGSSTPILLPSSGVTSDGAAPGSSPTATVRAGLGYLASYWTPVSNNDPVTYDVYVSATTGFTPGVTADALTPVVSTMASSTIIKTLVSGTALALGTTYYVKIIARDADGSAAAGTQGSGAPASVNTADIAAAAVTATEIANAAVITAKIATDAVTANEIAANAVTSSELASAAVITAKIAADAVTANEIAANAVGTSELDSLAVTSAKLAAASVILGKIDTDAVDAAAIAASAVGTSELAALAVTAAKIAANTITAGQIAANTITASQIAADTITANEIAANAITTSELNALAVTAAKIAANTITASQIAAGTITTTEIAALTITASNIAAATITGAKIAATTIAAGNIVANTITAGQIAAGTITATEIAANTITAAKIVAGTITTTEIASGTILAANIAAGTITGSNIAATTIAAGNIVANTITASQIAADTITANEIAANAITTSELNALAVTAAKIAANTITASQIAAGTITATEIATDAITAVKILAGAVTATKINVTTLDAISVNMGTLTAGTITATATVNAGAVSTGTLAVGGVTFSGTIGSNGTGLVIDAGQVTLNNLNASNITTGTLNVTDHIGANAIDATKLSATLTFSNIFQTSAPGTQRIVIDGTAGTGGIFLYNSSNAAIISLPLDSSASASFTGNITTGAITITGNLTIQGTTNIMDKGSALTLNEKLGDASVAPTLGWEYNDLALSGGTNGFTPSTGGVYYDSAGGSGGATPVYYVGANSTGSARVEEYDASTGVATGRTALIGADCSIYGVTRVGAKIWVLYNDASLTKTWARITQSTFAIDTTVAASNLPNSAFTVTGIQFGASGTGGLGVGTDGTFVLVIGWATATNGAVKTIKRFDVSGGTPSLNSTQSLINGAALTSPLGTAKSMVGIASDGTNYWTLMQRFSSSGSPLGIELEKYVISTLTLGVATGDTMFDVDLTSAETKGFGGSPQGVTWDNTNSRLVLGTATTKVSRMTTWIPSSSKLWVAYAWQVANVSVGTATVSTATPSLVTVAAGHGLSVNDEISFTNTGGALPTGITAGTPYYVRSASLTTTTFTFSTTKGGSGVHASTTGSGTQNVFKQQESLVSPRSSVALTDSSGNQGYRKRVRVTTVAFSSTITNAPIYAICQTGTPATTDLLKERTSSGFLDTDSSTPMLITGEDTGGQVPRTTSNLAGATSTIQGSFANGTPWKIGGDGTFVIPIGRQGSPSTGQVDLYSTDDRMEWYDGATNGYRQLATLGDALGGPSFNVNLSRGLSKAQSVKTGSLLAETMPWEIALLSENAKATPAGSALTNQRLTLQAVWLEQGQVVTGLQMYNLTAYTATPTDYTLGLWTYDGTTFTCVLASGQLNVGNGFRGSAALSYTVPSSGIYYVGTLFNGTVGTGTSLQFVDGASLLIVAGDFTGAKVNPGFSTTTWPRVAAYAGVTSQATSGGAGISTHTGAFTVPQNMPYVAVVGTIL